MPFALEFQLGYDDVIEPAVREAGLECVRADKEALGHIHQMMFERIFESPVVIADISGGNPNVFYELGVSHAATCRTVTVARQDYADRIPFDIAPYRVIIYPKRPDEGASDGDMSEYEARRGEAASSLAAAISAVVGQEAGGVSNPVQAYLSTRSPMTCSESRYVDALTDSGEEEMIRGAASEIIAVGITGGHFVRVLARIIEAGERTDPLRVQILCLDPNDRDGWRYVYHLREGRVVDDAEFEDLLAEDRMMIELARRNIDRLNRTQGFQGELTCYSGIPVVWAYVVDQTRIMVGNYAMNRLSARLPVSVLVRDDPRTRAMYRYYSAVVEGLVESTAGAGAVAEAPEQG